MSNSPKDALQARYIDKEASLAGWDDSGANYWRYPVIDTNGAIIAYRLKRYPNASVKAKYLWEEGKPSNPDSQWYIQQDTKAAILAASGVAFLANGEPASLAYRAGGVKNVLATTLSEVAVPEGAASYLKAIGVSRLLYPVDSDKAGHTSAINWRDALAGSGLDFEAYSWPSDMPAKADANDVLIACQGDSSRFQAILSSGLIALSLPAMEAKAKKAFVPIEFDKASFVGALQSALSQGDYLGRKTHQNTWLECHCPFHDDKEISAGFNLESGVINCMGACGKAYSPREVAERLGVDWKAYFPKSEGKKKPIKADYTRFAETLDNLPIASEISDKRSYAETLRDEAMARLMVYEDGQYVSFFAGNLPLGVLSAVLTLANGRSHLALFLGRLHQALKTGKLATVFSTEEAMQALGMSRSAISRCVFEAEHLGFLHFLRSIIIDSKVSKEGAKNLGGRPPMLYMVELDGRDIQFHLLKMLEIYYLEKHAKHALAMPSIQMASQVKAGANGLQLWQNRVKAALSDSANKQAKQAFDTEMFGNGTTWKGWHKAIETQYAAPLDYFSFADSQDLRAGLLHWWVTTVRDCNSRDELARLLGCTDPVIDAVLEKANLKSEKQNTKLEFAPPSSVKAMAYEYAKQQRDLRGKAWKISYWIQGQNGWSAASEENYLEIFSQYFGQISKVFMIVTTPSKQVPLTELEIAERNEAKRLEAEEKDKLAETAASEAPESTTSEKPKADKAISDTRATIYQKWDKHTYAFLYRQLQLMIHCFTPCRLGLDGIIFDKSDNPIHSGQLPELFQWLSENASEKPVRKVKAFFGKGYNEEKDFEALQALADSRKAALGLVESFEFEGEDVESLPIFNEVPKQVPLPRVLPKPVPVVEAPTLETTAIESEESAPMLTSSVVYFIKCEALNKMYIASTNDYQTQKANDLSALRIGKHSCLALQSAFREFGEGAFRWGLLGNYAPSELQAKEAYWRQRYAKDRPFAIFNLARMEA